MSHQCPAPGCRERFIPDSLLACRIHWNRLSADLRVEINDAWREKIRGGDGGRHLVAVAEAMRYWLQA